jgi:hypothetical protein
MPAQSPLSAQRAALRSAPDCKIRDGAAAENGDQRKFMVSWTVGGPFSLALHLKPVGAERPDWHAAELLITAFSRLDSAANVFCPTNLNALLKTAKWSNP